MIAEIRLQNYRSYTSQSFIFAPGVNIIVGPNACGKTNLLEAIMVSCLGASYRAKDSELIKQGANWARLDTKMSKNETRTVKIVKTNIGTQKEFYIEDKSLKRLSGNHKIPMILFEPNHLLLMTGAPELRRSYLDNILDQINPQFRKVNRDYLKTLRQRNALLKTASVLSGDFFAWNLKLSYLGGIIACSRAALIDEINKYITDTYQQLSKDNCKLRLDYSTELDLNNYQSQMLKKLEANTQRDSLIGYTTIGPHREDFRVQINDNSLASRASRGEARTLLVSIKLIEVKLIEQKLKVKPLILLDDLFGELDKNRSKLLATYLKDYQSIITTNDQQGIRTNFHQPFIIDLSIH